VTFDIKTTFLYGNIEENVYEVWSKSKV